MALTINIGTVTYNSDGTEAVITDTTTYGSPNIARADAYVYLQLWKMDEDEVETVVEVDNDEPESASTWTFDSSTDGWYRALLKVIPEWVSGNYTVGQVVAYSDGNLYISILNGVGNPLPTNLTYFSPIEFDDEDIIEADNVEYAYEDYLVIEQGKLCAGEAAAEWFKSKDCSNCDKVKFAESMFQKRALVITAQRYAMIDLFVKAEQIARKLETSCESC